MKLQFLGKPDVSLLRRIAYPVVKTTSTNRQQRIGGLKENYVITNNKVLLTMAVQYLYKNSISEKHTINSIFFEDSKEFSEIGILSDLFNKVIVSEVITAQSNIDLMIKVNGLSSTGEKYVENIVPDTEYKALLHSLYVVNGIGKTELEPGVYKFVEEQVIKKETKTKTDIFLEDNTLTGIDVSALSVENIMTSKFIYDLLLAKKELYLFVDNYNGVPMKTICWEYSTIL